MNERMKEIQNSILVALTLINDFITFPFKYEGYDCLIIHTTTYNETLCGYVALTENNKLYGEKDVEINCHGGITFSEYGNDNFWTKLNDKGEKLYWIGFDCSHIYDITLVNNKYVTNKTPDFVAMEIFSMVHQLQTFENFKETNI